jgi:glucose-6-phosphate-specific signal transduction histidine kinase
MNYQLNAGSPGVFDTGISLQLLVNRLVSSSQGMAFRNKSTVVNEVPRDIHVVADKSKVVPIIEELLTTVVTNARNSQIHISADRYKDIVILNIQDRNNYNGYALAFSIMSIESQINEAGGSLIIDGKQKKIATISFSFPNYAVAS